MMVDYPYYNPEREGKAREQRERADLLGYFFTYAKIWLLLTLALLILEKTA